VPQEGRRGHQVYLWIAHQAGRNTMPECVWRHPFDLGQPRVLFTGNSCRSQTAEAIVNARLGDVWEVYSAGRQPTGYVHPLALRALAEIGIQHEGRSKHADEYRAVPFDIVVTVCDDAAENCPVWLGQGKRLHLGFPDPAKATGTDDEIMAAFRQVRDDIARQVPDLLKASPIES
jgi:arsenate reductase